MATFAKATFNATKYAASRPTYPRQLYDFIFKDHAIGSGCWDTAVDVGCGTGQATVELAPFERIIGIDPSAYMISQAREFVKTHPYLSRVDFELSPAENLKPLLNQSADLIIAAQAAHWFDWDKFWPEAARVLNKNGTFAAWGYSEFRLSHYPSATPLINDYAQGTDPENSLGPYWERPGRTILDNHLLDVPDPTQVLPDQFSSFERVFFTGDHYPALPNHQPVILRKRMTWEEFMGYLRTWSSLHTFHERHPEDLQNSDGDIATRFWNRLKKVASTNGRNIPRNDAMVDIEWPLALILARKA